MYGNILKQINFEAWNAHNEEERPQRVIFIYISLLNWAIFVFSQKHLLTTNILSCIAYKTCWPKKLILESRPVSKVRYFVRLCGFCLNFNQKTNDKTKVLFTHIAHSHQTNIPLAISAYWYSCTRPSKTYEENKTTQIKAKKRKLKEKNRIAHSH